MHVVLGGAFAGKRSYVKEQYPNGEWIEAGQQELSSRLQPLIVDRIAPWLYSGNSAPAFWEWVEQLPEKRTLILILEEMGQGIVPVEPEDRRLRDENGRLSQEAAARAAVVDYVWHGLVQRWKEEIEK